MKQLTIISSLILVLSLSIGCGGASNATAEDVVNLAMKALQAGDKDNFMSLAYRGDVEDILDEMDEYEEFWADFEEEEGLSIDSWSTPAIIERMPEDQAEGDVIAGAILETMVSLSFEDDNETENVIFTVVQTSEGWFIIEIDA